MQGYVAVTDHGWYEHLSRQGFWSEVNFWRPSAGAGFRGAPGTPFFFKLKRPHYAICGFGQVNRYLPLPEWRAWECFGEGNGASSYGAMKTRLQEIRARRSSSDTGEIGCIVLSNAVFFPPEFWIPQPVDWSANNLTSKLYDLSRDEGRRIWVACMRHVADLGDLGYWSADASAEAIARYGAGQLVKPRLGQGTFRIAVADAYGGACAVTGEHSLPALEAAHIRPYADSGPHEIPNGLLLRADLHRLLDQGYVTVTRDWRLEVSPRLRTDYENGRSYYPHHGRCIAVPDDPKCRPGEDFLRWHNDNVYLGR